MSPLAESLFFTGSVVVLAALLFLPITRIIWVLSMRRLYRKRGEEAAERERRGQLIRARLLALFLVIVFSLMFNLVSLGVPGGR